MDSKMGVSVLLRLFISSNDVCNKSQNRMPLETKNTQHSLRPLAYTRAELQFQIMGPIIPKHIKYNLHYGDVR